MEISPLDKTSIKSQAINYRTDRIVDFYIKRLQEITDKAGSEIHYGAYDMFMPTVDANTLLIEWGALYRDFTDYRREVYPLLGF